MDDEQKTCHKCKQSKPIEQFYRNCRMRDGYLNDCKMCQDESNWKIRQTEHGASVQAACNYRSTARNRTTLYRDTKKEILREAQEAFACFGLTLTRIPSLSEMTKKHLPKGVLIRNEIEHDSLLEV